MIIKWFEKHRKISLTITLISVCLIFYISSLSFSDGVDYGFPGLFSIIYHISAFFFFGFFVLISLVRGRSKLSLFILGGIIAFMYAITDEIHQFFVPGRYCSFFDIGLDSVGILFALIIYGVIVAKRKK